MDKYSNKIIIDCYLDIFPFLHFFLFFIIKILLSFFNVQIFKSKANQRSYLNIFLKYKISQYSNRGILENISHLEIFLKNVKMKVTLFSFPKYKDTHICEMKFSECAVN